MKENSKKQQILNAAFKCFVNKGYSNTSINDIINEYGKSKGSVYYYFKSKEEIFLLMFSNVIKEVEQNLKNEMDNSKTLNEFIEKFLDFFFKTLEEDLDFLKAIIEFWIISLHNKKVQKKFKETRITFFKLFEKFKCEFENKTKFIDFVDYFLLILSGLRIEKILIDKQFKTSFKKLIFNNMISLVK